MRRCDRRSWAGGGAGLLWETPCFEIQFVDFIYPGWNQLVSNMATLRWRSFGHWESAGDLRTLRRLPARRSAVAQRAAGILCPDSGHSCGGAFDAGGRGGLFLDGAAWRGPDHHSSAKASDVGGQAVPDAAEALPLRQAGVAGRRGAGLGNALNSWRRRWRRWTRSWMWS